jgi:pyridoxal phosphate enzyme (YggS family)
LLAVKTQAVGAVRAAIEAGGLLIGQNRVQEMAAVEEHLADLTHETHLIGQLQTNKIGQAMAWATCIETVDSERLVQRLDSRARAREACQDIMIQVNTSREPSKAGVQVEEAEELIHKALAAAGLRVTGLMTVGLNSTDMVAVARSYEALARLRDKVRREAGSAADDLTELSMGMSADLEVAVAEGASVVRLGSAVFGTRAG